MGKYSEFLYESTYVAGGDVYGFDTIISSLSPDRGPSTGGQAFVLRGEGMKYDGYDDNWTNSSLDLIKWVDISSGSGSILTASPNLLLSTGISSGSIAGVRTVDTFSNAQFETKVSIPSISAYPVSSVSLFSFDMYVNSSNYSRITVMYNTTDSEVKLSCAVVVGGKTVDNYTVTWTTGVSVFRILRFGSYVYFYANGQIFYKSSRFIATNAYFRYFNANWSAAYNVSSVKVLYAKLKTFVAFDNQIVYDPTVVSSYRLRGITPPSIDLKFKEGAYSGYVDISVVSGSTVTQSNFYEYYFVDNLVILNSSQFNVKMNIIDDSTVRTPVNELKGLGGGK